MPDTTRCPLCGNADTKPIVTRTRVPVHQNLVLRGREEARALGQGRLEMRLCAACGWAFNAAFDPALLQYGKDYDNSQACSPAFQSYLDERINHLVRDR